MNYTLDRFQSRAAAPAKGDVLDVVKEALELPMLSGSLARLMARKHEKDKSRNNAKKAMIAFLSVQPQAEEVSDDTSLLTKILQRVLKKVGKRVIKAIVRPIIQFAARAAMTIIRFAVQTVLRFVLIPIFQAVAAFVIANPITAALIAAAGVGAAAYYGWKKLFGEKEPPGVPVPPEVEAAKQAEADHDIAEVGTQAQVTGAEAQTVETAARPETSMVEKATTATARALDRVKEYVAPKKKKKAEKFTGFGADVDAHIEEASRRYPILPLDVFRGFVKMEGGWTGAMSPTGAIGTGQFIQSTWDALAATPEGKEIGMTKIGKRFRTPEDPRYDKRVNTLATGLLASQNATMLQKRGLPVTGENLYMMHNIGPGIIPVMLGQPATPQTLTAMRQNGMRPGMTAADFLEYQKGRFREAYEDANGKTYVNQDQPQMTPATTVDAAQRKEAKAQAKPQVIGTSQKKQGTDLIRGPGNSIVKA